MRILIVAILALLVAIFCCKAFVSETSTPPSYPMPVLAYHASARRSGAIYPVVVEVDLDNSLGTERDLLLELKLKPGVAQPHEVTKNIQIAAGSKSHVTLVTPYESKVAFDGQARRFKASNIAPGRAVEVDFSVQQSLPLSGPIHW
jgi:hypothetical protein